MSGCGHSSAEPAQASEPSEERAIDPVCGMKVRLPAKHAHTHEGTDLDVGYGQETLKNLHRIWTRPVHLLTTFEERRTMLTFDGSEFSERAV